MKKWFKITAVVVLMLCSFVFFLDLFYGKQTAEWLLRSLKKKGLSVQLQKASLFRGELVASHFLLKRTTPFQTMVLRSKKANIRLNWFAFLFAGKKMSFLQVDSPSIEIQQSQAPQPSVSASKTRKKWLQMLQKARETLRILDFVVRDGTLSFQLQTPHQKIAWNIPRLDAQFRRLEGQVRIQNAKWTIENQHKKIEGKIHSAQFRFHLGHFWEKGSLEISEILLKKPSFLLQQNQRTQPPIQAKKTVVLPPIVLGKTSIQDGSFVLHQQGKHSRKLVQIASFSGDFQSFVGKIEARHVTIENQDVFRKVKIALPVLKLQMNLGELLERKMILDELVMVQPKIQAWVSAKKMKSQGKWKQKTPWLEIKKLRIEEGFLHFHKQKKAQNPLSLQLTEMKADLSGFHLWKIFTQPFEGQMSFRLNNSHAMTLRSRKSKDKHQILLKPLSIRTLWLQRNSSKETPVEVTKGEIWVTLSIISLPKEKYELRSLIQIRDLKVEMKAQKKGIKGKIMGSLTKLLNQRFVEMKTGYSIRTQLRVSKDFLEREPKVVFQDLQELWLVATLQGLIQQHPLLRFLKPLLKKRAQKNPRMARLFEQLEKQKSFQIKKKEKKAKPFFRKRPFFRLFRKRFRSKE